MIRRRPLLTLIGSLPLTAVALRAAHANAAKSSAFIKATGDSLVAAVNGPGSLDQKRAAMTRIVDQAVDVDGIAKFCLGRFWRTATAQQRQEYVKLFHEVLVTNILTKLGEYKGVTFTVSRARPDGETDVVSTVVDRPNNPPTNVDWVIAEVGSAPKIVDVVAEGTSLRLTQRQDYASYLTHNNNSIDALINAMKNQIAQNS